MAIEDVACYMVRAGSRMNPFLGRNFEAMDPLEWLALTGRPHPRTRASTETHFCAYYANRVRGQRSPEHDGGPKDETEAPKWRRCTPSWARLIAKVY